MDKVQKIREEVERLKEWQPIATPSLNKLLSLLDTMQEEPVSIWHDASEKPNIKEKGSIFVITSLNGEYIGSRYYNYNDVTITFGNYDKWAYINDLLNLSNIIKTVKEWKEEPLSEDLEEAANAESLKWAEGHSFPYRPWLRQCFINGAKWKEKQDQSTIELAEDHAMLAGMEKMKEQMMAKAIDGKVLINGMGNPILHLWDKGRHLIDKKVKVIVIKED